MNLQYKQQGLTLPTVLIIVVLILIGSTAFIVRSSDDMKMGGSSRDADLVLNLADTGLNQVAERFSSADTPGVANSPGDLNGNAKLDAEEGYTDLSAATPPTVLPLNYAFYISGSTAPAVLQNVANGEASNTSCTNTNQKFTCGNLKINDMFISATYHPFLFIQTETGFQASTATNWTAETSRNKVAVWLEYVQSPENTKWVDVYAQSAAQSGHAKAYVQKFVGTFSQSSGIIAPLTESATHGDFTIQ